MATLSVNTPEDVMSVQTSTISRQASAPSEPLPGDDDFELLRRYATLGDPQAFAQIVHRYAGFVYATCLRVVGNTAAAEDLSQETFFRLMRRPQEISRSLGGWLHQTATHLALDALRSEKSRLHREISYVHDCNRDASTWAELSPAVDQALSDMPEEFRTLLVKHYLLGETQNELAAAANQSPSTISRRMCQALEALRQHLRLKGVYALPAVLAGLLCHVAARQAPASLLHELDKMAMVSGATAAARTAQFGSPHPRQMLRPRRPISHYFSPQMGIAAVGMIGAVLLLRLLWNVGIPAAIEPARPEPETQMRSAVNGRTNNQGSDGLRQAGGEIRNAPATEKESR